MLAAPSIARATPFAGSSPLQRLCGFPGLLPFAFVGVALAPLVLEIRNQRVAHAGNGASSGGASLLAEYHGLDTQGRPCPFVPNPGVEDIPLFPLSKKKKKKKRRFFLAICCLRAIFISALLVPSASPDPTIIQTSPLPPTNPFFFVAVCHCGRSSSLVRDTHIAD